MTLETSKPRSRRAFLGASLAGGLAAVAAHALGRPAVTSAANADPITVGGTFTGTNATTIENTTPDATALVARATGVGDPFVEGYSTGIHGSTTNGRGVHGSTSGGGYGVFGEAVAGAGVVGRSGTGPSDLGVGVVAEAGPNGTALYVSGRASFTRSGRTMIPAGRSYVDIRPQLGLAPIEQTGVVGILATLQQHRPGVYVAAVRGNYPSPGTARIYLNKVASSTLKTPVTWFVLG
jgi:hypothetical protein